MALSKASTADCATSASTSTCSPISRRRARSSKNGGSTTTPTDRTRASTGSHRPSSQHAPHRGITGTDSPYKRGQVGEQVTALCSELEIFSNVFGSTALPLSSAVTKTRSTASLAAFLLAPLAGTTPPPEYEPNCF